jgi:hypothetical protein
MLADFSVAGRVVQGTAVVMSLLAVVVLAGV